MRIRLQFPTAQNAREDYYIHVSRKRVILAFLVGVFTGWILL